MKILIFVLLLLACDPSSYNEISGTVIDVEYMAEKMSWAEPDIKRTIVTFKDGRIKIFNGLSNAIFQKNKFNVIYFNSSNYIVSVQVK